MLRVVCCGRARRVRGARKAEEQEGDAPQRRGTRARTGSPWGRLPRSACSRRSPPCAARRRSGPPGSPSREPSPAHRWGRRARTGCSRCRCRRSSPRATCSPRCAQPPWAWPVCARRVSENLDLLSGRLAASAARGTQPARRPLVQPMARAGSRGREAAVACARAALRVKWCNQPGIRNPRRPAHAAPSVTRGAWRS